MVRLAAVTASLLHLTLNSGATVTVDYSPDKMPASEATERGLKIADWIWNDFCNTSAQTKCNVGSYYKVEIVLGNKPRYCLAIISGQGADSIGSIPASKYREVGHYRCYFRDNDPEYHVYWDNSPDFFDVH